MSEDFGAAIVDAAAAVESTPVATTDSAVETPSTSTTTTTTTPDTDLSVIDSSTEGAEETAEGKETELKNADGTEKTPEQQEDFRAKAAGKEPLPAEVRTALKAMRDADPKNAAVVKQLHGAFERYTAIKDALGAEGPNGLKHFLSEVGAKNIAEARATLAQTQTMMDTVKATDELLYKADPVLSANVLADMEANGVAEQYPKVVANFLDHLKEANVESFYEVTKPHMVAGLQEAGLDKAINSVWKALSSGDTETAKGVLKQIGDWYSGLRDEVSERGKIAKALSEREATLVANETKAQTEARTATERSIAESCEKISNTTLGKSLGGFLRLPFFKDFPYETKVDIGNGIKDRLYAALKADKAYQSSMRTLWAAKTPDRARMEQVHQNWLTDHGQQIVSDLIKSRYPGYAKGGSAAGKAAAAVATKAAGAAAAKQSVTSGKPIYVASRPENLIRTDVKIGGRVYTSSDLQVLQISGKGFVKTADGKGVKFVSWRKN